MNDKNVMMYSSIIATVFLFVVGGQGYTKAQTGCLEDETPSFATGYNDAQNDYLD